MQEKVESDNEKLLISIVTKVTLGMHKMSVSHKYLTLNKIITKEKSVHQDYNITVSFDDRKYFLHGWCR